MQNSQEDQDAADISGYRRLALVGALAIPLVFVALLANTVMSSPDVEAAQKPPIASISRIMGYLCPGPKDYTATVNCSTQAERIAIEDIYRRLEIENQYRSQGYTIVATLVAIFAFLTTLMGVIFVGRTLIETRRAVRSSIEANKGFEDANQRQSRAYVVVTAGVAELVVGSKVRLFVDYKNVGLTPAHSLVVSNGVSEQIEADETQYVLLPNHKAPRTLGPQLEGHTNVYGPVLTASMVNDLRSGAKALVFFGAISYRDAFDQPRTTNFRFIYDTMTAISAKTRLNFDPSGGNDST